MKRFILRRTGGWYARLRAFEVLVDGVKVATLKPGDEVPIEVMDVAEWLQVKVDWGKSPPINIRYLNDGQTLEIKGYLTLNPIKNLGADALPIRITPV